MLSRNQSLTKALTWQYIFFNGPGSPNLWLPQVCLQSEEVWTPCSPFSGCSAKIPPKDIIPVWSSPCMQCSRWAPAKTKLYSKTLCQQLSPDGMHRPNRHFPVEGPTPFPFPRLCSLLHTPVIYHMGLSGFLYGWIQPFKAAKKIFFFFFWRLDWQAEDYEKGLRKTRNGAQGKDTRLMSLLLRQHWAIGSVH